MSQPTIARKEVYMENYFILDNQSEKIILINSYESLYLFLEEISFDLTNCKYIGQVYFDTIIHSGNNQERFVWSYFNGESFDTNSFKFISIPRISRIREVSCDYIRKNINLVNVFTISSIQKELLMAGVCI